MASFFLIRAKLRYAVAGVALLLAFLAPAAVRAEGHDIVQFGNDIVVHQGEEAHDLVCIACSIEVDGTVHGNMVALLGSIHVRGHAEHDAVTVLGSITLGEGATIANDVVVFAGGLHTAPGASIGKDRVVFPFVLFLLPLLFVVGMLALIIWAFRVLLYRNRPPYPMPPPRS